MMMFLFTLLFHLFTFLLFYLVLFREEPAPEEEKPNNSFFARSTMKPSSPLRASTAAPQVLHDASFVYIGRARSHTAEITGICFGLKDGEETLISISEDQ